MTELVDRSYRESGPSTSPSSSCWRCPLVSSGVLCALAVRLTSRGPVLFRQERVGFLGRPFEMLKFRSMIDHPDGNPVFPDPDRITAVGRILRATSLDELPQLLNVARGDMSIVGPRPTLAYQVERYDEGQRQRLSVRPGLTGLSQIRLRNSAAWPERIALDLEYIQTSGIRTDLAILVGTVPAVLRRSGVDGHPQDDPLAQTPDRSP